MQNKSYHLLTLIQEKEAELFDLKMESNQIEKAQAICKVKYDCTARDISGLKEELKSLEDTSQIIEKGNETITARWEDGALHITRDAATQEGRRNIMKEAQKGDKETGRDVWNKFLQFVNSIPGRKDELIID